MNPIFQAREKVLAALRLSGAISSDAQTIIDQALSEVRLGIIEGLGLDRVNTLAALTPTESPTTTDQLDRCKAEIMESEWVRMLLLSRLPSLFMDAAQGASQIYNEEGLTRGLSSREIERQVEEIQTKIDNWLAALSGDADDGSIQASSIGPSTTPPGPFFSVFP